MSVMLFSTYYYDQKNSNEETLQNAGIMLENDTTYYNVIFSSNDKDSQQLYNAIKQVLDVCNANLYALRTSDNGKSMTEYIYCTDLNVFDNLVLTSGRFFKQDEMQSNYFLSTSITHNNNQIGRLASYPGNNFELRTIYNNLSADLFQGQFSLIISENNYSKLQSMLSSQGIIVTNSTSIAFTQQIRYTIEEWIAVSLTLFILLLIILYDVINSYKKLSIEKLLGYRITTIWSKRIPAILICEAAISLITVIAGTIILFHTNTSSVVAFLTGIIKIYLIIILISAFLFTLPFLYVRKIKLTNVLKNKQPTFAILAFNACIKMALSVLIICFAFDALSQLSLINARYTTAYKNWETTKSLAILDGSISQDNGYDPFSSANNLGFMKAYMDFNRSDAILADFKYFIPSTASMEPEITGFKLFATVNPNYLQQFPAYDENNEPVKISESDKDYVLLVPEKYKNDQQQIIAWYTPMAQKGQTIQIIWLRDDQSFFTYRLDIATQNGNCVLDPVLNVLTEQNADVGSYSLIDYSSAPLKIKVNDISNSSSEIAAIMGKYFDLSKVSFPVENIYSVVGAQIQMANQMIATYIILLIIFILIMSTIVFQNVLSYFNQYKQRLAIQHFLGYKAISKYRDFLLMILLSFLIVSTISMAILHSYTVLLFTAGLAGLELLITIIFIFINQRKNILRVLKGG